MGRLSHLSDQSRILSLVRNSLILSRVDRNVQKFVIGKRPIDLYELVIQVQRYGGSINVNIILNFLSIISDFLSPSQVNCDGLWNNIALNMGLIPTSIGETGYTQDQITRRITTVYESILEHLEADFKAVLSEKMPEVFDQQRVDHQGVLKRPGAESNNALSQQLSLPQLKRRATVSADQVRAS